MKNNHIFLIFLIANLFISLVACDTIKPTTENGKVTESLKNKPNVLVIVTDDQGWADVNYCGAKDMVTPTMDMLFVEGKKFNKFYANSSVCSPTRASFLTGQYPDKVGVPGVIRSEPKDNWGYLDSTVVTIADVLKDNGYSTGMIGKWHLGQEKPNIPNQYGFDFFKGFLGDMMDDYWTHRRRGQNLMRFNEKVIDPEGHATDLFSNWAVDYIQNASKEANKKPFFLYLAYNAPHYPIQPPKDYIDRVVQRNPEISLKRAELVAFIEHMDDGIQLVIDELKSTGLYDNTLIVFTSDNGGRILDGANNGNFRDGKQSMYEGGLLVPTSVVWKDKIKPSTETDFKAMTMDIMPTILDVLNIDYKGNIQGESFSNALFEDESENIETRQLYFVRREGNPKYLGQCIYALQYQGWKLVYNKPFTEGELFNLNEDPYEKTDLKSVNPKKFDELNLLLMNHVKDAGSVQWQAAKK